VVSQAVRTMHDIHGASQRIRGIVSVTDTIASQTSILALNAAVETAAATKKLDDQVQGLKAQISRFRIH